MVKLKKLRFSAPLKIFPHLKEFLPSQSVFKTLLCPL